MNRILSVALFVIFLALIFSAGIFVLRFWYIFVILGVYLWWQGRRKLNKRPPQDSSAPYDPDKEIKADAEVVDEDK